MACIKLENMAISTMCDLSSVPRVFPHRDRRQTVPIFVPKFVIAIPKPADRQN